MIRYALPAVLLLLLGTALATEDDGIPVYQAAERITFKVMEDARWDDATFDWREAAYGSGFGFRADGWVVATAHQVNDVKSLTLICPDGTAREADFWVWSKGIDLAVIHIPDYEVPVANFADSDVLRPGETVFAVGAPIGRSQVVTRGVVGALHSVLKLDGEYTASFQDYIWTDAQANAGSSGGPLLNRRGEVVGVVCESLSVLPKSTPGVSFAIPANLVRAIGERLVAERGEFRHATLDMDTASCFHWPKSVRERLGYWSEKGAIIVKPGDHARKQGLRAEDIIVSVDGKEVVNWAHLDALLATYRPGVTVKLDIHRNRERLTLEVVLEAWMPD